MAYIPNLNLIGCLMFPNVSSPGPLIAGAILAGGQSRRMGKPKEGVLLWDNLSMLEHVAQALRFMEHPVIIVGQCSGYPINNDLSFVRLMDEYPGRGPAFALKTLLSSGLADYYLLASCDQPLLESALLQQLVDEISTHPEQAIFFKSVNKSQNGEINFDPFPGVYPASLLPQVEQAIQQGQFALRKLFQAQSVHWVSLPEDQEFRLKNCNTPADVEAVNLLLSDPKQQLPIPIHAVSS